MGKPDAAKGVGRRSFLAGVATAGAVVAAPGAAPPAAAATVAPPVAKLGPPPPAVLAADTQPIQFTASDAAYHVLNPGSDYMVDVVRSVGIDYVVAMPGSTFRGIQESFINYGNGKPEWITAVHEEVSAAMAHGYAKVAGKPLAIVVHSTVGLQHASMPIYNAWCDRVPMLVLVGNIMDSTLRRPGVEWYHTAVDLAAIVRGYIKYDDSPISLDQFRESTQRAYALMTTPPMGPSVIIVDGMVAEDPIGRKPAPIPAYHQPSPPVGDPTAVEEAAQMLVAASEPVIVAGRYGRTAQGMQLLMQLAELLQAPVKDLGDRMNFPNVHRLNQSFNPALIRGADLVLNLENDNLFGVVADVPDTVVRHTVSHIKPGTKVIDINSELIVGAGNYQDKQRYYPADLSIPGEAEATLPLLIDAVQRHLTPARRGQNDARSERFRTAFENRLKADLTEAALGWDASPISVPRMCMEVWNQIQHEDWALVSTASFLSNWPQRLWSFDKYYQWIGGSGGGGVGYQGAAGVGAALGHKGTGRLAVNICGDGELMVLPGSLWTAAHHRIPLLTVVHNNRAWHQEHMHVLRMADRRERNPNRSAIGTVIDDPAIDYAKMGESFGLHGEGPVTDPAQLAPALARAIKAVKAGQPAIVDVVTQGR